MSEKASNGNNRNANGNIVFKLAHRLSRRHDLAYVNQISCSGNLDSVLVSEQARAWLNQQGLHELDIISKLHLLLERETDDHKRYFGFQYRGQAMAFVIAYIDLFAWDNGIYRERSTGENTRLVNRTLHLFLFDEIYSAREQRLKKMRQLVPHTGKVASL